MRWTAPKQTSLLVIPLRYLATDWIEFRRNNKFPRISVIFETDLLISTKAPSFIQEIDHATSRKNDARSTRSPRLVWFSSIVAVELTLCTGRQRVTMSSSQSSLSAMESLKSISSSPPRPSQDNNSLPKYRTTKQLPFELREHCLIYFEEGLCMYTLTMVDQIL